MVCMQDRKLFDHGEYMVIAVNDEFYNPDYKMSYEMRPSEYYGETLYVASTQHHGRNFDESH